MKNNTHELNYYTNSRDLQLLIDARFAEKVIPENDSVRLLDKMVEEMDLSALYGTYACTGRPTAVPPSTTLKIMLYASMEGIRAPRQIQKCCERDMNYIWLLDGAAAPEFNHFERFRRDHLSKCADTLFTLKTQKVPHFINMAGILMTLIIGQISQWMDTVFLMKHPSRP